MTTISVVIPTYNRAHLVGEAIESVLGQSFRDFELIVVDDGSTDGTETVVRSYSDPRLRYIFQENQGVAAARNTGIHTGAGELIAFLDSDDLFLPDRLSTQLAKLATVPSAGLVYGRYYHVKETGDQDNLSGRCADEPDLERLLLGPAFHWSTTLIRRSVLIEVGGFDPRINAGEEWELTLRLALSGCRMICVEEPVALIRYQPISITRSVYRREASGVAVLEKTFNDPRMPPEMLGLRASARAALFFRLAGSAYVGSEPESGSDLLLRGIKTIDPELLLERETVDPFLQRFVEFLAGVSLDDPEKTVRRIIDQLPGEEIFRRKLHRRLWERFLVGMAFKAYHGYRPTQARNFAFRAFVHSPRNLANRGLVSVFIQSLVLIKPVRA